MSEPRLERLACPGADGEWWLVCPKCGAWHSLAAFQGQDLPCPTCKLVTLEASKVNSEEIDAQR